MTDAQKRYFVISSIFICLFLIIIDLLVLNKRIEQASNIFYEKHLKELQRQNVITQKRIDTLNLLLLDGQKEIKRIADQKDKIKAIYVKNDKKIDTLSGNELIYEFNIFFSKVTQK